MPVLTSLTIKNFTLVESLELEFSSGMTAITGETGAGKSVLLNALGLTLGNRADYEQIRRGAKRADVIASFDIKRIPSAQQFLQQHELDDGNECILRRSISSTGNGKAWINGSPVTLSTLRELSEQLIDIHSQHEHQSLQKKSHHRELLDNYGNLQAPLSALKTTYQQWQQKLSQLQTFTDQADEITAKRDLLTYQVAELDELDLQPNEFEELENEYAILANAEKNLGILDQLQQLIDSDNSHTDMSILSGIRQATQLAEQLELGQTQAATDAQRMLQEAEVLIDEARDSIHRCADKVELNPARLSEVASRISQAFDLGRKHHVEPNDLYGFHQQLKTELSDLCPAEDSIDQLKAEISLYEAQYLKQAAKLSKQRKTAAKKLTAAVNSYFASLNMQGANIELRLDTCAPSILGMETVEFYICTNTGQPHKALAKVASGGEMSRISMVIQVVTAKTSQLSCLVFDEVDVGIGGNTGDVVGHLLRELGAVSQVLCVTHLPQVAGKAHQHLLVEKSSNQHSTSTDITPLNDEQRLREIARMLGGNDKSQQTIAHAKEILNTGQYTGKDVNIT